MDAEKGDLKLSHINGEINRMAREDLVTGLKGLNLDTRGNVLVLKKRMKAYFKKQKLRDNMDNPPKHFDYFCIIDFEATCDNPTPTNFDPEIIEFPAILIDIAERKIVNEFHRYCRPVVNPTLTTFCTNLTGISQEQVDKSLTFPDVLVEFEKWLATCKLGTNYSYVIVTDGPWDMGRFLYRQAILSHIKYPSYAKKWVNIRKIFRNFYKTRGLNLQQMLDYLGLHFEGTPHCGIDDSRNIAKIVLRLLCDGALVRVNEMLDEHASANAVQAVLPMTRKEYFSKIKKCSNIKIQHEDGDVDGDDENNSDEVAEEKEAPNT